MTLFLGQKEHLDSCAETEFAKIKIHLKQEGKKPKETDNNILMESQKCLQERFCPHDSSISKL